MFLLYFSFCKNYTNIDQLNNLCHEIQRSNDTKLIYRVEKCISNFYFKGNKIKF